MPLDLDKNKITVNSEISLEEIVFQLISSVRFEDIEKFVALLDGQVADWGFTVNLIRHFKHLEQEYLKELENTSEEVGDLSPKRIE